MNQIILDINTSPEAHEWYEGKESNHWERVKSLRSIKNKLIYINENICSLSKYNINGQIFFDDNSGTRKRVYCGCQAHRTRPDFNPNHEKIYLALRKREVKRIVAEISKINDYKGKLKFLHNLMGYNLYSLKIFDCPLYKDEDLKKEDIFEAPIIDLTPKTEIEILEYNEYLEKAYLFIMKDSNGFTSAYKDFNFEKEKRQLLEELPELNPIIPIEDYLNKIEEYTDYPARKDEVLNKYDYLPFHKVDNTYLRGKYIFRQLAYNKESALKNKLCLNSKQLDIMALKQIIHAKEIFKFYKFLKVLQNRLKAGETFKEILHHLQNFEANNNSSKEFGDNNTKHPDKAANQKEIDQETTKKLIIFNKPDIIDSLFEELKDFFPEREADLKTALQGAKLDTLLLFPHNQNKFTEVFRRLKYNGFITNSQTEINNWLCTNFQFRYKKGKTEELRNFNQSSVWNLLSKAAGEPPKNERICQLYWLPYKSPGQLQTEAEKENN